MLRIAAHQIGLVFISTKAHSRKKDREDSLDTTASSDCLSSELQPLKVETGFECRCLKSFQPEEAQ